MGFCFDYQHLSSCPKLFKSDHSLGSYSQMMNSSLGSAIAECAILGTVALLLANLFS